MCKCPEGFELDENMKTCEKVHPCDTNAKGGCEDICKKNGTGVNCACKEGHRLNKDGRTCSKGKILLFPNLV